MRQKITIVGLGPGREEELTLGALKALQKGQNIILRTQQHGIASFLEEQGIEYTTLDDIYEDCDSFDEVYSTMVQRIREKSKEGEVVLGVPGHPMVGERLVFEIIKALDSKTFHIDIIGGISQADRVLTLVDHATPEGMKIVIASEMTRYNLDPRMATVILDINSLLLAADIKLMLLRTYPPELKIYICNNKEEQGFQCEAIELYQLDRLDLYDHNTCLYIPSVELEALENYDFNHLTEIMAILRSPEGCPWDKEQTNHSLRQYLIEETYEVLEAIEMGDYGKIAEELGDLLLQIVFHAQIAKEHGEFDIQDVTTGICHKMIDRHPHIFGNIIAKTPDQVVDNWEAIKKREKGLDSYTQVLRDIPSNLPSLMRANKIQKKAAMVGFDWDRVEDAMLKIEEELDEFKQAHKGQKQDKIIEELGDLLFAVVNVGRFLRVEPELALRGTIEKFISRFEYIEQKSQKPLEEMTLDEMDSLWNEAKSAFSNRKQV